MFQTGDPTGTGKGGTSYLGRKMEDEFHDALKVLSSQPIIESPQSVIGYFYILITY